MLSLLNVAFVSFLSLSDINFNYLFHHYQNQFNKNYSLEEYDQKFQAFKDNVVFMFKNKDLHNYTLGFNQFTDMTIDEFKNHHMFYNYNSLFGGNCNTMEYTGKSTPDSIDWREKNAVTPVKNQGQCGSCWSFSATGAMEGINALKNGKLVSLSEQELVDCSYSYGNVGCNGGLMDNAFGYVVEHGICSESDYPYVGKVTTCEESLCDPVVKISGCYDVPSNNELALREAVSQQPVSVAIEADTRTFQLYTSGVITSESCGTNLDHGVLVVGYGEEDGIPYWLVKNSWGDSWGDNGYVKIGRSNSTSSHGTCGIAMQPSYPSV